MTRFFLMLSSLGFLLGACVTSPYRDFEKIKVGMHKDDVLDSLGSPHKSDFKDDRNYYTYRFIEQDKERFREVILSADQVEYVGETLPAKARKAHRIQKGMNKGQVMEALGLPHSTKKTSNGEQWVYYFKGDNLLIRQDFSFENETLVSQSTQDAVSQEDPVEVQATPAGPVEFTPVD